MLIDSDDCFYECFVTHGQSIMVTKGGGRVSLQAAVVGGIHFITLSDVYYALASSTTCYHTVNAKKRELL